MLQQDAQLSASWQVDRQASSFRGASMRRISSKPAGEPASKYRPLPRIPAAEHLRKYASACHDLAERETDSARQELFRAMECTWEAVAAQVERGRFDGQDAGDAMPIAQLAATPIRDMLDHLQHE
jgi:hypothetical protein